MTLEDLERRRPEIEALCRRFEVKRLDVFGSVVRGEARPDSDVDFRVSFDPDAWITLYDLMDLKQNLSEALGAEVDISEDVPSGNRYFAESLAASRRSFFIA